MTYEREDELVKKLENENYKGTKSLVKELENKFGEMHYQNIDSKQRYINSMYDSLSSSGEAKLNKVIEKTPPHPQPSIQAANNPSPPTYSRPYYSSLIAIWRHVFKRKYKCRYFYIRRIKRFTKKYKI